MKVQIYSYLDLPNGSICNVAYRWYIELSNHFVTRFLPLGLHRTDVFKEVEIGEIEKPDFAVVIGYPSLVTRIPNNNHLRAKKRIGVFVSDTFLASKEVECIRLTRDKWNLVCLPSEYCAAIYCENIVRSRAMVVHHGIASNFYPREVGKENLRTYLAIYHQSPSGGTYIRKNIKAVIEAFAALQEKYKNVQLIIKSSIYEGSTIDKDIQGVGNVIVSRLPLSNDELACLYSRCHAHVHASLAEGFGITPLEAMACGINVIAPIHSGMKEYLTSQNCIEIPHSRSDVIYNYAMNYGRLFQVKSEDIYKAMEKEYLGNHNLCPNNLSKWARENFSWSRALYPAIEWIKRS